MLHTQRISRCLISICLLAAVTAALPAQAQEEGEEPAVTEGASAEPDWFLDCALGGRLNPLGLSLSSRLGYRWPLSDDPALLLRETRLDLAVDAAVTPAYAAFGPFVEVTPLAVLRLRASAQRLQYFGTFGSISELGSVDADWSPERLDALDDAGAGRATGATRLELGGVLQAAAGPLLMAVDNGYTWVLADVDEPYYEPGFDLLLDDRDAVWTTTAFLGVQATDALILGARWERLATQRSQVRRQTAALLAVWDLPATWWGSPRLAALGGLYLDDPYRTLEPFVGLEVALRF